VIFLIREVLETLEQGSAPLYPVIRNLEFALNALMDSPGFPVESQRAAMKTQATLRGRLMSPLISFEKSDLLTAQKQMIFLRSITPFLERLNRILEDESIAIGFRSQIAFASMKEFYSTTQGTFALDRQNLDGGLMNYDRYTSALRSISTRFQSEASFAEFSETQEDSILQWARRIAENTRQL